MNKYQEALNRIKTIDIDLVQEEMGEKCLDVSIYGIHDYPTLEMSGDIDTLQEAIDKASKYDELLKKGVIKDE